VPYFVQREFHFSVKPRIGDFTCCVRESDIDERVPSGDFLFHVPYQLRRNSNLNANVFLAEASCTFYSSFGLLCVYQRIMSES
jgi:hypothetical protein